MAAALAPLEPNARNVNYRAIGFSPYHWAWPVSWGFLCGAVASGAITWPERWKAIVFILWFIADPLTAALMQGIASLRQAWQITPSPLESARALAGRLNAYFRTLLGDGLFRRAILWAGVALAVTFVLVARQSVEVQRFVLFLIGSVALCSASEQDVRLPWTVGLRVAGAWLLGYRAFAPFEVLAPGLGLFIGMGVGASLASEEGALCLARWVGRLAAWAVTLWLLLVRQPFLAAMGAALALNWEVLCVRVHPRPPRSIWRLAWLGLGMLVAMVQASGVTP